MECAVKRKEPIDFVSNNALWKFKKEFEANKSEKDIWKSWKI